jgi:hypothetical protein
MVPGIGCKPMGRLTSALSLVELGRLPGQERFDGLPKVLGGRGASA